MQFVTQEVTMKVKVSSSEDYKVFPGGSCTTSSGRLEHGSHGKEIWYGRTCQARIKNKNRALEGQDHQGT